LLKRAADVLVSAAGLLASLPLSAASAIAIWAAEGRPIFYLQPRVGRGGKSFQAIKFRSMVKDAEAQSGAVLAAENDPRITPLGKLLRKTALDELPQLINIFKGEMSFVGPRPERPEFVRELAAIHPSYRQRHRVPPGLTGLAQVCGRYHSTPEEKLSYDLLYLEERSLRLDLRIFLFSFLVSFRGRWDAKESHARLANFLGVQARGERKPDA
jgi:lipopolysaccharide/colanic/teichoic acid biosynthesis glycosyltransferase